MARRKTGQEGRNDKNDITWQGRKGTKEERARMKSGQEGRKGNKEGRARRKEWQEGRKDKKEGRVRRKEMTRRKK